MLGFNKWDWMKLGGGILTAFAGIMSFKDINDKRDKIASLQAQNTALAYLIEQDDKKRAEEPVEEVE